MFEGIGDDGLGDGDFWQNLDRDELARGCATTDPSLWLMFMAIVFVVSWNLRRTKKVK